MMRLHIRKRAHTEFGFATIEAILAIGVVGLVSVGLLGVSVALSSQSKSSRDNILTRQIAEEIAEQSTAHGCGLQSGSEVASVIGSVVLRCNKALGIDDDIKTFGDVSTSISRNGVTYQATIKYRWLPGTNADGEDSVSCSDLPSMVPDAVQRNVTIAWSSNNEDVNRYTLSQIEALPVDSSAFTGSGALLVTGMATGDVVNLQIPADTRFYLGRSASFMGEPLTGCAWFPYLSPGDYCITRVGVVGAEPRRFAVSNGTTTLAFDEPGESCEG
jgi:type II secretory pathway pseudopilin PulG